MVLAVDALQVAVRKEYVADAFGAAQGRFFTTVYTHSGCLGLATSLAEALCDGAIDSAVTWTIGTFHGAKLHFFLHFNY